MSSELLHLWADAHMDEAKLEVISTIGVLTEIGVGNKADGRMESVSSANFFFRHGCANASVASQVGRLHTCHPPLQHRGHQRTSGALDDGEGGEVERDGLLVEWVRLGCGTKDMARTEALPFVSSLTLTTC